MRALLSSGAGLHGVRLNSCRAMKERKSEVEGAYGKENLRSAFYKKEEMRWYGLKASTT